MINSKLIDKKIENLCQWELKRIHYHSNQAIVEYCGESTAQFNKYFDGLRQRLQGQFPANTALLPYNTGVVVDGAIGIEKDLAKWWRPSTFEAEKIIKQSHISDCSYKPPAPEGLSYLPYQRAGVKVLLERKNNLLADEMGLGKTIQALGLINATINKDETYNVLVVCPASLKINWKKEAEKWLVASAVNCQIVESKSNLEYMTPNENSVNLYIINYDILSKFRDELDKIVWSLIVCDEAHYLKNPLSNRTKLICGGRINGREFLPLAADRRLLMTGTPILNRPIEIFSLLNYLNPRMFGTKGNFKARYVGYDEKGAKNLDELSSLLRTVCMVRRMKNSVLSDLPSKRREIIDAEAPKLMAERYKKAESIVLAELGDIENIDKMQTIPLNMVSTLRKEAGLAKAQAVITHIKELLENSDGKFVVFGHHKDVLTSIQEGISQAGYQSVRVDGSTTMEKRDEYVQAFQQEYGPRIFIGNMQAAGVGLTLTRSSHVVFAELAWTPAEMIQAEDRCHRIGQKDSVNVQIFALPDSLDTNMARTLMNKADIINQTVNIEEKQDNKGVFSMSKFWVPFNMAIIRSGLAKVGLNNIYRKGFEDRIKCYDKRRRGKKAHCGDEGIKPHEIQKVEGVIQQMEKEEIPF